MFRSGILCYMLIHSYPWLLPAGLCLLRKMCVGNVTPQKFRNGWGEFYFVGGRKRRYEINILVSKGCTLLMVTFS